MTLQVNRKQCDQCLFGPNRVVSIERRTEVLANCIRDNTHFICHKHTIVKANVICHGFWRRKELWSTWMAIIDKHDLFQFVEEPNYET